MCMPPTPCFSKAAQTGTDSSKHSSSCQQPLMPISTGSPHLVSGYPAPLSRGWTAKNHQSAAPKSSWEVCSLIFQKLGEEGPLLECLAQCGGTLCFLNTKKKITFIELIPQRRISPSYLENASLWVDLLLQINPELMIKTAKWINKCANSFPLLLTFSKYCHRVKTQL